MVYIIYCDESSDKGEKFGDFFGGCIINSKDQYEVISRLEQKKTELNLTSEIKWTKVTENYLNKYIEIIDLFFDLIEEGKVKVRIIFRETKDKPPKSEESSYIDAKYFKLYYQFLKHSFGLKTIPAELTPARVIINLDVLPDKHGQREAFKRFLCEMPNTEDFAGVDIEIRDRDIIEVESHQHVLLQCTDIILGAMNFKLNGFDRRKPEGAIRRGRRTLAKEKLYKHIRQRISKIHPNFNVGVSTGNREIDNPHWDSPYEHWLFRPKE